MPPEKCNSITAKAMGLILSLLDVASARGTVYLYHTKTAKLWKKYYCCLQEIKRSCKVPDPKMYTVTTTMYYKKYCYKNFKVSEVTSSIGSSFQGLTKRWLNEWAHTSQNVCCLNILKGWPLVVLQVGEKNIYIQIIIVVDDVYAAPKSQKMWIKVGSQK